MLSARVGREPARFETVEIVRETRIQWRESSGWLATAEPRASTIAQHNSAPRGRSKTVAAGQCERPGVRAETPHPFPRLAGHVPDRLHFQRQALLTHRRPVKTLLPALLVLLVVAGLAAIKANQIGMLKHAAQTAAEAGPRPETVASASARKATWEYTLEAVGSVEAGKGVTISNDDPGIVTRIGFESGDEVKAGALLLELDTSVERAQLNSSKAKLALAKTTLERTRALVREQVATTAELDTARANVDTSSAEVSALQAQIARKVVRAPFSGKLGIRSVNLGQYLSPGSPITTLQSNKATYVDFSLPQQHLEEVRVGLPVKLSLKDARIDLTGNVAAIDPEVNEVTRSVKLRASVEDSDKRLRPGMFVNVSVHLDRTRELVMVPVTAVVYAPYGDSVFVLEDAKGKSKRPGHKVARQQFVRLGETRGDFVEVEKGLSGGELLVAAGAFKLRNGAPVVVNNEVELKPELHPKPPNR